MHSFQLFFLLNNVSYAPNPPCRPSTTSYNSLIPPPPSHKNQPHLLQPPFFHPHLPASYNIHPSTINLLLSTTHPPPDRVLYPARLRFAHASTCAHMCRQSLIISTPLRATSFLFLYTEGYYLYNISIPRCPCPPCHYAPSAVRPTYCIYPAYKLHRICALFHRVHAFKSCLFGTEHHPPPSSHCKLILLLAQCARSNVNGTRRIKISLFPAIRLYCNRAATACHHIIRFCRPHHSRFQKSLIQNIQPQSSLSCIPHLRTSKLAHTSPFYYHNCPHHATALPAHAIICPIASALLMLMHASSFPPQIYIILICAARPARFRAPIHKQPNQNTFYSFSSLKHNTNFQLTPDFITSILASHFRVNSQLSPRWIQPSNPLPPGVNTSQLPPEYRRAAAHCTNRTTACGSHLLPISPSRRTPTTPLTPHLTKGSNALCITSPVFPLIRATNHSLRGTNATPNQSVFVYSRKPQVLQILLRNPTRLTVSISCHASTTVVHTSLAFAVCCTNSRPRTIIATQLSSSVDR